ncbi:hypothetical protein J4442_05675 [Candidatus Woesearchaeota archaeon]|nr:hypothetical protein [Candidatus Woesearchaeota archaeon]
MKKSSSKNFIFYKKGDSSMVAAVLLIMAAITAGVMVTSFSQKSTQKVSDKIIELGTSVECNDIRLSISIKDGNIMVKNRGTLGVDQIVMRKYTGSDVDVDPPIDEFEGAGKLLPGIEFNAGSTGGANRIEAKPVFVNSEGDLIGCNTIGYDLPNE